MTARNGDARWTAVYREFVRRCRAAGVLEPTPLFDAARATVVLGLYAATFAALLAAPQWPMRLVLLAVAALAAVQAGMMGHDAGHGALAWSRGRLGWPGQLFLTIAAGWPFAHWVEYHHAHHRHTNEERHDPDIQEGMFALSPGQASRRRGLRRLTSRHQHLVLWPVGTLVAFGIRWRGVLFILRGGRATRADRVAMALHLALWLGLPSLVLGPLPALANYLLWSWMMGPYMMATFFWNHVGARPVAEGEKLPFFVQRLLCTRNLSSHWAVTLISGGLNHHVEHHLIPCAPIARLGRARRILVDLCAQHSLPHRVHGYREAFADVYRYLRAVGRSVPGRRR